MLDDEPHIPVLLDRCVELLGPALTVRIPHVNGSIIREALKMACPGDVPSDARDGPV